MLTDFPNSFSIVFAHNKINIVITKMLLHKHTNLVLGDVNRIFFTRSSQWWSGCSTTTHIVLDLLSLIWDMAKDARLFIASLHNEPVHPGYEDKYHSRSYRWVERQKSNNPGRLWHLIRASLFAWTPAAIFFKKMICVKFMLLAPFCCTSQNPA